MKYFSKLDSNNIVINLIVCDDDYTEQYCDNTLGGTHKETWVDGSQRQRFAQIGGSYDPVKDLFIDIQTHPSWALDSNNEWQAPVAYPTVTAWGETDDIYPIIWDEDKQRWTGSSREGGVSLIWNSDTSSWSEE
tara:strand:+ start:225 stop:626 length:402 start_codon:yes stop_codon:yes gene_type:complete